MLYIRSRLLQERSKLVTRNTKDVYGQEKEPTQPAGESGADMVNIVPGK